MKTKSVIKLVIVALVLLLAGVSVGRDDWQSQEVDWRMTSRGRIREIRYPREKPLLTLERLKADRLESFSIATDLSTAMISSNIIDSPPIDGFIPWIVVINTDKRQGEFKLDAVPTTIIDGNFPSGSDPLTDYAIGIFDTGASAHLMSNAAAVRAGLFAGDPCLVTTNPVELKGVNDSIEAWVSQPLGIYIDGLEAVGEDGLLMETTEMVGQTNTSIIVGMGDGGDIPTAIGTPMSVYYTTVINNSYEITVSRDGNDFTSPAVKFYEPGDSRIPEYSQVIPLELKPLGGISVQYVPYLDILNIFEDPLAIDFGTPQTPSVIIGNLSQSIFFVHSVDITDAGNSAIDKDRFMFDTGAQVSVIGSRIGARLGLNPSEPEFEVVIEGASGGVSTVDGFYLDSLKIPALGQWLEFTNVPVILLDISSPEGGTLDGIIGMNLFTEFNMVLQGGGLFLQDDPRLELQRTSVIADIAPSGGDGVVDTLDLAVLVEAWLSTSNPTPSLNWNPQADLGPLPNPDGRINFKDFRILAEFWLDQTGL